MKRHTSRHLPVRKGEEMRAVAFSYDNKLLGGVGENDFITLWWVSSGSTAWRIPNAALRRLQTTRFGKTQGY